MFNKHLLKKGLTPAEVEEIHQKQRSPKEGWKYVQTLPIYTFACCPFCLVKNIEHLDTYAVWRWGSHSIHEGAYSDKGMKSHCEHLVLVKSFRYVFPTKWWKKKFAFEKLFPYVAGLILEQGLAKAVIHALPICELVDNKFVPRHAVFIFCYFSEQPEKALREFDYHGAERTGYLMETRSYAIPPRPEEKPWMDLPYWVERGLLYWVNPYAIEENYDPQNCLKTYDTASFPYGNLRALVAED